MRLSDGILLGIGLALALPTGAAAAQAPILVEIDGAEGVTFTATCHYLADGQEQVVELSGALPLRREIVAPHLICRVTQTSAEGSLAIALRGPTGNVSRTRTRGAGSTIRIEIS